MHKRKRSKSTMQILVLRMCKSWKGSGYLWPDGRSSELFCTHDDERLFEFLGKYANQLLKGQLSKKLIMGTMMCIIIFPKCRDGSSFEIWFRPSPDSGRPQSVNTVHSWQVIFTTQGTTGVFRRIKLVKSLSILQQLWKKKESMQKQLCQGVSLPNPGVLCMW